MKTYLTLLFALLLLCTGAGAALASTPDGQTPAEETVCDDETGAAYGLCNAYVSMDCHTNNPSASEIACSKVAAKFQQITGRDLPCEVPTVTCPCNDLAAGTLFFVEAVAGQRAILSCSISPSGMIEISLGPSVFVFVDPGNGRCGQFPGGVTVSIPTPEKAQFCVQLLEQAANSQGVTCN